MACKFMLGFSFLSSGRFQEAGETLKEVENFTERFGVEWIGGPARVFLGVVSIAKGDLSQGMKRLEEGRRIWLKKQRRWCYAQCEYTLGKVYRQIAEGAAPISLPKMAKNIGFLAKSIPSARRKAEDHFNKAIEVAREIGAKGVLGQIYLDLGLLHMAKNKRDEARVCLSEAVGLFEQCEAKVYLKQAQEVLERLG
jgi:tetratricopeptide (TPR) repeat protein